MSKSSWILLHHEMMVVVVVATGATYHITTSIPTLSFLCRPDVLPVTKHQCQSTEANQ